jgi:hypothetical protein
MERTVSFESLFEVAFVFFVFPTDDADVIDDS